MLKRCVRLFLLLLLIHILTVAFFRHTLCRLLICGATVKATGLELSIEELSLDVLHNSLYMRGITLFNPPGFKNKVLGKAEEIFIKYDLLAFLRGRLHLRQIKVDISEVNIIRSEKGRSNVASFKKEASRATTPAKPKRPPVQKEVRTNKQRRPKFLIDRLEFSVKKVSFIGYKVGKAEASVIVFKTKEPFVFKNVSDLGYVLDSVSAKGGLRNLLDNLLGIIPQDLLKNTTESIKESIKSVLPMAD